MYYQFIYYPNREQLMLFDHSDDSVKKLGRATGTETAGCDLEREPSAGGCGVVPRLPRSGSLSRVSVAFGQR